MAKAFLEYCLSLMLFRQDFWLSAFVEVISL